MVDVARVEALAGPQGTLYGSDAQAGTLRIITNKPKMNEFEAVFDGELEGGGQSQRQATVVRWSLTCRLLMINWRFVLLLTVITEGGYIDNVLGLHG